MRDVSDQEIAEAMTAILTDRVADSRNRKHTATVDLRAAAVALRQHGATLQTVADTAGVSIRTLRRWLAA